MKQCKIRFTSRVDGEREQRMQHPCIVGRGWSRRRARRRRRGDQSWRVHWNFINSTVPMYGGMRHIYWPNSEWTNFCSKIVRLQGGILNVVVWNVTSSGILVHIWLEGGRTWKNLFEIIQDWHVCLWCLESSQLLIEFSINWHAQLLKKRSVGDFKVYWLESVCLSFCLKTEKA